MKKLFKKILIILIIFIVVFEFGFSSTTNAAIVTEENINAITNLAGGIVSIKLWLPRILMTASAFILNKLMEGIARTERCYTR